MMALTITLIFAGVFGLGWAEHNRKERIARYREWESRMFAEEKEREQQAALDRNISE